MLYFKAVNPISKNEFGRYIYNIPFQAVDAEHFRTFWICLQMSHLQRFQTLGLRIFIIEVYAISSKVDSFIKCSLCVFSTQTIVFIIVMCFCYKLFARSLWAWQRQYKCFRFIIRNIISYQLTIIISISPNTLPYILCLLS